ncbi:unnamed protein product [Larinioides sclopetarius]|uniref:MATH domain-containing protein n=1 Tax=Larinioides sclopetarius TaxID=280406 RepID=A0AAV2BHJ5_9ARAC
MNANASHDCQKKAHYTFIWSIENGNSLLVSTYLKSPKFTAQSLEKTTWSLVVNSVFRSKTLDLLLKREEDIGPDRIEIEFELSILDGDGSSLGMTTGKETFTNSHHLWVRLYPDTDDIFFRRSGEFLPNDTFTVRYRMWRTETEISRPDTCFARTRLGMDRRCFVWGIREFSNILPKQKKTQILNPTSHGSPQLILSLFFTEKNGKNYVNIQINQNSASGSRFVFCKIFLLDSDGRAVHSKEFHGSILFKNPQVFTFSEFFEIDKLMNGESSLLQNDVLYLRCEFLIGTEPIWSRIDSSGSSCAKDLESITTELLDMHLGEPYKSCVPGCPFKKHSKNCTVTTA